MGLHFFLVIIVLAKLRIELTFIICYRESVSTTVGSEEHTLSMIGDVNIFLKGDPGQEDFEAEVEIMIAG